MRISKKLLIVLAGCMWFIAGFNVLRIGIQVWDTRKMMTLSHFSGLIATFLFFVFIFSRAYQKNIERISQLETPLNPFSVFDLKGWLIIVLMISLGFSVRHFRLLPNAFIAFFYQGLGSCLLIFGLLFLRTGFKFVANKN